MKKVAVIDYDAGNLDSVVRAVEECQGSPFITNKSEDIAEGDCIILPGVGTFIEGMRNIKSLGIDQAIKDQVCIRGIPILGICLGMQLLATRGFEGGDTEGLCLIPGEVARLHPDAPDTKIPHVGWNEVNLKKSSPLFQNIATGKDFYFVHSYNFICKDEDDILAVTPYCGNFVSAICRNNIFGTQFHPEKSLRSGLTLMRNFLSI